MYLLAALHFLQYLTVQGVYPRAENTYSNTGTPNTTKVIKTLQVQVQLQSLNSPTVSFYPSTRHGFQRNSQLSRGQEPHEKNRPSPDLRQTSYEGNVLYLQPCRLEVHKFRSYLVELLGYLSFNIFPESPVSLEEVSKHHQCYSQY